MSLLGKSTKAVIFGGLFFIIPLLLLFVLLKHAWDLLNPLVQKLVDVFNIQSIFGAATIMIITILMFILLCFISGTLLRKGIISDWGEKMEDQLFLMFPSLQMFKYKMVGDATKHKNVNHWKPILLKEESFYLIAFITKEHENGFISIYVPDAPKMDAGEIRFIHGTKCEYVNISMKDAMQALSSFGKQAQLSNLFKN